MKQNIYDDPEMFRKYGAMLRSRKGLEEAGEWDAFKGMLPPLREKRILDLGCGYGWHCRWAAEEGARRVVGVDISERMIAQAREMTTDTRITYILQAMEDISFPADSFDVVISSLALHYVKDIGDVFRKAADCLAPGGVFAFSVEHPIFTCQSAQDWCTDAGGRRAHWPVDSYMDEGVRETGWLVEGVIKYHRTTATYVNTLVDSGFQLAKLMEPGPAPALLARHPEWRDETRRPMFLLVSAMKKGAGR